ncbi:MAG TPA: FRG domain-containing protein [Gemmatimonadaceae bacterium]|nr:FRG domain-containing protein [Gemmatimonadaceae bacterium]
MAMHEVEQVEVRSLGELIDRVTPERPDPITGRRRDTCVYHGAPDASRHLLTSLDRLGGVTPPHGKTGLEEHILRNFARYSRPFVQQAGNEWELMVTAQHHGVPTRLLDWTYSPLVAAHFATRGTLERDRAIWQLDWMKVHRHFGFPELALLIHDLAELVGRRGEFTPWRLIGEGDGGKPFACMIEPPTLDTRISAQSAVFTLCSDTSHSFDEFLDEHGLLDALTRFVIPKESSSYVRDQLDIAGFDERRLFPDLDGVAAQLRRYYS